MIPPVAQLEGLSKRYRIGSLGTSYGRLTESLWNAMTRPFRGRQPRTEDTRYIWALKNLDLEAHQGDVIGVVGRNGAGKTTLLKLLARITEPTEGRGELHGRVGSLLEVGTGFHPELTGRENVYLNGAILGMRRREITGKFDEIVEFAEVSHFLDTPVKRYSSGMKVRLAFSVAASLEPEILIIDEVLTVGDAAFQKKCLGKMNEVARGGRTVFFVSHNMGAVSELCTRAILLEKGHKVVDGSVGDVIERYAELISAGGHNIEVEPDPSRPCSIVAIELTDRSGSLTTSFDLEDEVRIKVRYVVLRPLRGLQITATLARNMIDVVHSFDTDQLDHIPDRAPGTYEAEYVIPPRFLKAGNYTVRLTAGTPEELLQDLEGALSFEIEERSENTHMKGYRKERQGHVISPGTWTTTRIG
jgi:lipopolysaccharide transport system ATP-binding protein